MPAVHLVEHRVYGCEHFAAELIPSVCLHVCYFSAQNGLLYSFGLCSEVANVTHRAIAGKFLGANSAVTLLPSCYA